MRTVVIKNNSSESKDVIKTFAPGEEFTVPSIQLIEEFASNQTVLEYVVDGTFSIGNGSSFLISTTDQLNWLLGNVPIDIDLGDSAATSTGQSYPVPVATMIQADYNQRTRLTTDYFGLLQTRGPIFTDEGSFRDDFPAAGIFTDLTGTVSFENGSEFVTGVGTCFAEELFQDSYIKYETDGNEYFLQVKAVESNTRAELWEAYQGTTATGTGVHSHWKPVIDDDGQITNQDSCIKLVSGVAVGATYVTRPMDYLPIKIRALISISARVEGQRQCFGVADIYGDQANYAAMFVFIGGINTQVGCCSRSSCDDDNTQHSVVTVPNGQTTNLFNSYSIDVGTDTVSFFINDILVASHKKHIPGPYDEMDIFLSNSNLEAVQSSTYMLVDYVQLINNDEVVLAPPYLEPKETDGRRVSHETPRRLGTYTYFTGSDDDHTNPVKYGGDSNIVDFCDHHQVGDSATKVLYGDFNSIENETFIHEGSVDTQDSKNDYFLLEVVPKTTSYTSGSGTNFYLYGGYLIIPVSGTGNITVSENDIVLIQNVANEYGVKPAGYWNADWNLTTKVFENIVPAPNGDGNYNIFGAEVALARFGNRVRTLGSGTKHFQSQDITQIGHNMRVKVTAKTEGTDHEWWWNLMLKLYRKKTC